MQEDGCISADCMRSVLPAACATTAPPTSHPIPRGPQRQGVGQVKIAIRDRLDPPLHSHQRVLKPYARNGMQVQLQFRPPEGIRQSLPIEWQALSQWEKEKPSERRPMAPVCPITSPRWPLRPFIWTKAPCERERAIPKRCAMRVHRGSVFQGRAAHRSIRRDGEAVCGVHPRK